MRRGLKGMVAKRFGEGAVGVTDLGWGGWSEAKGSVERLGDILVIELLQDMDLPHD